MMYVFVVICCLLYVVLSDESLMSMGVSESHLSGSFVYMFSHSSWLHLLINTLSLCMLWKPIFRLWRGVTLWLMLYTYLGAVLSGCICAMDVPTVGSSGMVFFLLGVLLLLNPTLGQLRSYIWVLLSILLQIYLGRSNVGLHILSFVEGCMLVIIRESWRKLDEYRGIHTDK